jgi:hypothetical protein
MPHDHDLEAVQNTVPGAPAEEGLDHASIEEDLELESEEKKNRTDGADGS